MTNPWREHRFAPKVGTELCRVDSLPDEEGKEFVFGESESKWPFRMFVVRRGGEVRGFVNTCPHLHLTLNYFPDRFVTHDKAYILCANHGAVFNHDDGHCITGPCAGQDLEPVPIVIDEGMVRIA